MAKGEKKQPKQDDPKLKIEGSFDDVINLALGKKIEQKKDAKPKQDDKKK